MKLLLDTNALLWLLNDNRELGGLAREVIASASALVVADATLWEVAIKVSRGKLTVAPDFAPSIRAVGFERPGFADRYFDTFARLPMHHRDPFDRMLIAHALTDDLAVVTSDRIFSKYGVRTIDASV